MLVLRSAHPRSRADPSRWALTIAAVASERTDGKRSPAEQDSSPTDHGGRGMRTHRFVTLCLVALASLAAVPVSAALGHPALAGQAAEWSVPLRASLRTPSGHYGTFVVRPVHRRHATWCAKAKFDTGEHPVVGKTCGAGPEPGLHGMMAADCAAGELVAFGAIKRRLFTVFQPRGDAPAHGSYRAVTLTPPAGFRGRFYAIVVDLHQRSPGLIAEHKDGEDAAEVSFKREARRCRSAMWLYGGF